MGKDDSFMENEEPWNCSKSIITIVMIFSPLVNNLSECFIIKRTQHKRGNFISLKGPTRGLTQNHTLNFSGKLLRRQKACPIQLHAQELISKMVCFHK